MRVCFRLGCAAGRGPSATEELTSLLPALLQRRTTQDHCSSRTGRPAQALRLRLLIALGTPHDFSWSLTVHLPFVFLRTWLLQLLRVSSSSPRPQRTAFSLRLDRASNSFSFFPHPEPLIHRRSPGFFPFSAYANLFADRTTTLRWDSWRTRRPRPTSAKMETPLDSSLPPAYPRERPSTRKASLATWATLERSLLPPLRSFLLLLSSPGS